MRGDGGGQKEAKLGGACSSRPARANARRGGAGEGQRIESLRLLPTAPTAGLPYRSSAWLCGLRPERFRLPRSRAAP
eukprot:1350861-Pyramimonas_sp.AAC.1